MVGTGTIVDGTPLAEVKGNGVWLIAPVTEEVGKAVDHFGGQFFERERTVTYKQLERPRALR